MTAARSSAPSSTVAPAVSGWQAPGEARATPAGWASAASARSRHRGRYLSYAALITVLIVLVASQRSLLAQSVGALRQMNWVWVPVMLLADFASRVAVASTHCRLLRTGGAQISQRAALQVAYAANAVSATLPVAGAQVAAAFTFRQFLRAGTSPATTAWALLISGLAATSSFAGLVVVGAVATGTASGMALGIGGAMLAALPAWALLAAVRSASGRRHLQSLMVRVLGTWRRGTRKPGPAPEVTLQAVLAQVTVLRLRPCDRAYIVLLAVANWLFDCLCLAAAILAVGATVPWQGLLLAFLTAAGATTLALTPGGLGTVEIALTAALVGSGMNAPQALAAALVYRVASLWLPVLGGWLVYLRLRSQARDDPPATGLPAVAVDVGSVISNARPAHPSGVPSTRRAASR